MSGTLPANVEKPGRLRHLWQLYRTAVGDRWIDVPLVGQSRERSIAETPNPVTNSDTCFSWRKDLP